MRGQEGDIVHVTQRTALQPGDRVPMSWEEFWALDSEVLGGLRAEYIDGQAIVMTSPRFRHQQALSRLTVAIAPALPEGSAVLQVWGWKPGDDYFVPDLLVCERGEDHYLTSTPHLAVEVLSSNRSHDTKLKYARYAEAGLERYWIVDPDGPTITVYRLDGDTYTEVAGHEPGTVAELDIGIAAISLDPADLT